MVGKIAIRESTDDKFEQPRKHHSSNSITHRLPDKHRKNFMKRKRKPLKLNTKSASIIRPYLQIRLRQGQLRRDERPTGHATTSTTDQHTSGTGKPVACPVGQGSGWIDWWQSSNSWSSSSNSWQPSTGWQERVGALKNV